MASSSWLGTLVCLCLLGLAHATVLTSPLCDTAADCPQYATCSANYCTCDTDYVLSADWSKCLQVIAVPYDATNKCEDDFQCIAWLSSGGACSEGMCVCKAGYHYLHGRCHESKGIGEACEKDDNCYSAYSSEALKCDGTTKKCVCADGFYQVDVYGTCRKQGTTVGDQCMFDLDCKSTSATLYCDQIIHQCLDDTSVGVTPSKGTVPTVYSKYGRSCSYNGQCYESSMECLLDTCVCTNRYSNFDNYCRLDLGETCTSNDDCAHIDQAECGTNKLCRCRLPFVKHENNRECRLGVTYESECEIDEQCMFLGGDASCRDDGTSTLRCLCRYGYHFEKKVQLCVPDRELYEDCVNDFDCITDPSHCLGRKCQCLPDYHDNNLACLPDVTGVSDYCLDSSDCTLENALPHSECINNACTCSSGYYQSDDGSTCLTGVGGKCTADADCTVSDTICTLGKCACKNGTTFYSAGNKCLPVGVKDSDCEQDIQCTDNLGFDGGACISGICNCNSGYHYANSHCWDTRWLASTTGFKAPPCTKTADCPDHALCSLNYCQCESPYVFTADWSACVEVNPFPYDADKICEDDAQCITWLSSGGTCSEGMCVCKDGYHYLHGRCFKSIGLDGDCEYSENCYSAYSYEAAQCGTGNKCECADGFYRVGNYDTCRKEGTTVGDECVFDIGCTSSSLYCNETINQCVEDSTDYTPTTKSTVPTMSGPKIGDSCDYNIDCNPARTSRMECFLNQCICTKGYFNFSDYCFPELGETCTSNNDCAHISHAECGTNNLCRCRLPYVKHENNRECKPAREYGKNCQTDEYCMLFGGGAFCQDTGNGKLRCRCKTGYHYVVSIKLCIPDVELSEECVNDYDCSTENSLCKKGKCDCQPGFHENNSTCVADVTKLGDYCLTSYDCERDSLEFSECANNKCSCILGYYENVNATACLTGVSGSCDSDTACDVTHSVCEDEKCACIDDFIASANKDKCLPVGGKNSECEEDVQCSVKLGVEGGTCINGTCGCNEGYHYRNSYCWDIRYLGDPCERHSQCYLQSGRSERVNCENGYCKCDHKYEQTLDLDCTSGVGRFSASSVAVSGLLLLIAVLNMRDGWTAGRP